MQRLRAGRLSEELLDLSLARERYEESLQERPNAIVERRRRRLGARDEHLPEGRFEMIANQLRRADNHPCGSRANDCDVAVLAAARSGGGRLLRAAVVALRGEGVDDEIDAYYLAWTGPRGAYRWGQQLGPDGNEASIEFDDPELSIGFRPMIPGRGEPVPAPH